MNKQSKGHIVELIDIQLDFLFSSIGDDFNLDSGDISPEQSVILDEIKEKLLSLSIDYVKNNK